MRIRGRLQGEQMAKLLIYPELRQETGISRLLEHLSANIVIDWVPLQSGDSEASEPSQVVT